MKSQIQTLKRTFALVLGGTVLALNGWSQTNYVEDFESGNLNAWTIYGTQTALAMLQTNKVPANGQWSALLTNSANRMYLYNANNWGVTADSWRASWWIHDTTTAASRVYNEVRQYTSFDPLAPANGIAQLLAAGKMNSVTMAGEVYNANKYQARMANGGPSGWFNLDGPGSPNRSAGWHKFVIERGVNAYSERILNFYVDGVLCRTFTNSAANLAPNLVVLGTGLGTTAGNAYFDGLMIESGQTFITKNPENTTITEGSALYLEADAIGAADPVSIQWQRYGTNLPGETNPYLSISPVTMADAGPYRIVASNSLAIKTSTVATVTIKLPLYVSVQPTNVIVNPGGSASFYAEAVGVGNVSYFWRKNGNPISGSDGTGLVATYTIPSTVTGDTALYSVTFTNDLGHAPATSDAASLIVNTPPSLAATTNQTITVNTRARIFVTATDDVAVQATPFRDFETNTVGSTVTFGGPRVSGTTEGFLNTNLVNRTYVTNALPLGNNSPRAVFSTWTWWSNSPPAWLRLTTSSTGVSSGANPIISYTNRLRFGIWADKNLRIAVGARDTNPTGDIGTAGGGTGELEHIGVNGAPTSGVAAATNVVVANAWTNLVFDPRYDGVYAAIAGVGNSVLNSTTGKGVLEHLALIPGDGLAGTYTIYLDDFVVIPNNDITFALTSGPTGAVIDPNTGIISWTPDTLGTFEFGVTATDYLGQSTSKTFSVQVAKAAPGTISITRDGSNAILNWSGSYTLESAPTPTGTWNAVPGVQTGPYTNAIGNTNAFFRLSN